MEIEKDCTSTTQEANRPNLRKKIKRIPKNINEKRMKLHDKENTCLTREPSICYEPRSVKESTAFRGLHGSMTTTH